MAQSWSIFRVVYTSLYFLLYLLLLALLLISPADAIERSLRNGQTYNIWMLIIFYVVTISFVCFVYFVRLYVNKTVLANIPKHWLPIEEAGVKNKVRSMVVEGLDRSAAIAFESRPRVEDEGPRVVGGGLGVSRELQSALWDGIEHEGWGSPKSDDFPDLQYSTVLSELPNLIEAKAMTLAPPDPTSQEDPPLLEPEVVALLQRPSSLSLRGYVDHLASLGALTPDETTTSFLQLYEHARFSTRPLSKARFRELMDLFAEILRVMVPPDLSALDGSSIHPSEDSYAAPSPSHPNDESRPSTPRSHVDTMSSQSSLRRPLPRTSSWKTYVTAPNTQQAISRKSSSSNSFAQTRHPYQPASGSSGASSSMSVRSDGSSSVIRLATRDDDEMLPYVLNLSGTAESFRTPMEPSREQV